MFKPFGRQSEIKGDYSHMNEMRRLSGFTLSGEFPACFEGSLSHQDAKNNNTNTCVELTFSPGVALSIYYVYFTGRKPRHREVKSLGLFTQLGSRGV